MLDAFIIINISFCDFVDSSAVQIGMSFGSAYDIYITYLMKREVLELFERSSLITAVDIGTAYLFFFS